MIERGRISIAICDNGCGAEGETDDVRNRHGGITQSHLPEGWKFLRIAGEDLHLCPACVPVDGDLFADRREAFEARYADFGRGLLPEICISLGMPLAIGRQWAGVLELEQARYAGQISQFGAGEGDDAAGIGTVAQVLDPGGPLDLVQVPADAAQAADRGGRVRGQADAGDQGHGNRFRGGHRASMRVRPCFRNRGTK